MENEHERKVAEAIRNPKNLGALQDADAIGAVGNSDCGEMLRMWIRFKEENGKRVIDQATFQSFGCETAIAVASLASETIRGKTAEEALALRGEELAPDLGPLPPMKIHCSQLVEEALRSALSSTKSDSGQIPSQTDGTQASSPSLLEKMTQSDLPEGKRIVFRKP